VNRFVFRILCVLLLLIGTTKFVQAQQGQRQTTGEDVTIERMRLEAAERIRLDSEQRDWETRIFPVRYIDPTQLKGVLSMFRASMEANQDLRVLSVRAPKEIMPAVEDAIKRLDVPAPRKDAELTIYVLTASDQSEPSSSIPSNLNSVINQLKGVLSYKGYRLVDTLITRATNRSGGINFGGQGTTLNGTLMLSETLKPSYNFRAQIQIENPDAKTPVLRLTNMAFGLQSPGLGNVGVTGDVEIPQGQQVIVGKATMADKALILVMSAKFD
jgi:hypothetical protein